MVKCVKVLKRKYFHLCGKNFVRKEKKRRQKNKKEKEKIKRICKICHKEFEGEDWMKQWYDCYKNFKGLKRIQLLGETGYTRGVFIVTHPDVSKEEVNEYIEERFASVFTPENWGAVEAPKRKLKLWWNCQNTD